jgi:hypothetical protein
VEDYCYHSTYSNERKDGKFTALKSSYALFTIDTNDLETHL